MAYDEDGEIHTEERKAFCHACGGEIALTIDGWRHTGGYAGEPHPILLGVDAESTEDGLQAVNVMGRQSGKDSEDDWEWYGILSSSSMGAFLVEGLSKTVKGMEWKLTGV